MKNYVAQFTSHLKESIQIAETFNLGKSFENISEVLILGLGGSGIGGSIAAQVFSDSLTVPVLSCKDYTIPSFVSNSTLVIASSYSGNTEETLIALEAAEKKSNQILCITSGGKLLEIAESKGYGFIKIPDGFPPRAAFGYSFPQVVKLLQACGLISLDFNKVFESAINLIETNTDSIKNEANKIAELIKDKKTIIYSQSDYEGVSVRFRQQLNENSKKLCWHHFFPEMNHNELVGWKEKGDDLAVVILRNDNDHKRNQIRMELCKTVFEKYCSTILEIYSKGSNKLERSLYLVHLCDWVSVLIAEKNNTDPIEIEVINFLKGELSKQ